MRAFQGSGLALGCGWIVPGKTFAILEGREASGGTWDLFRYPGVRSDSDMYTLGYRFRPWRDGKAIADGPAILNYIRETATEYDLDKEIRYGHTVNRAEWSSADSQWTVEVSVSSPHVSMGSTTAEDLPQSREAAKEPQRKALEFTCKFLYLCTGYYEYEAGYTPEWPSFDDYKGTVIHPQKWPEGLDYAGKRVIVIGSGATAVTLVPAMAETAEHVTMLQRSPTYVVSMPAEDKIANFLRAILPAKAAYVLMRWKNVLRQMFFYALSRKRPSMMKRMIAKGVEKEVGADIAAEHFTPNYNPWDQRVCLVPDSDLFSAIRSGRASVVTGEIERFMETGVCLTSASASGR